MKLYILFFSNSLDFFKRNGMRREVASLNTVAVDVGFVVDQHPSTGNPFCAPWLQVVGGCSIVSMDICLSCSVLPKSLTTGLHSFKSKDRSYLPIIEFLFLLIGKVAETIPLGATLSIERDLYNGSR